jgi:hypothetical protein
MSTNHLENIMRPARVGGNGKQRPPRAAVPDKEVGDNGKQRPPKTALPVKEVGGNGKQRPK